MENAKKIDSNDFFKQYLDQVKRTVIMLLIFAAVVLVTISFLQFDKTIVYGFLWGFLASLIYYIFITIRVKKCADMEPLVAQRYMGVGAILRFFFLSLMLILAIKIPQTNFLATVVGLFSFHVVMILDVLIVVFKENKLAKE